MIKSLLIIATIIVAGALALQDGQVCEPGSNFMVDCNVCRCSTDGKLMSCTRKFCVPDEQGDDPKTQPAEASASEIGEKEEEHLQTNGQVCTPNEVKMEDCNRCKCAANGIGWFCTRKACKPREKREAAVQRSSQNCRPGTSFKSSDGCNDCFCTDSGVAACTMRFCLPKVKREIAAQQKRAVEKCVPGTSFKAADGCNDCFCTETGIAACTLRFCFSNVEQGVSARLKRDVPAKCTPGSSFKSADGCNDCFCTETGIAACTLRFCFSNVEQAVSARPKRDVAAKCTPGTSFKSADGCNDCFCTETGIAACTLRFCFSNVEQGVTTRQKRDVQAKCTPGSSFKSADGCNDCFCTETGIAACTLKFCFTTPIKPNLPARRKRDNDGKCVPGTAFKSEDGCNDCVCSSNGNAVCTAKLCLSDKFKRSTNDDVPRSLIQPGAPGFSCVPNSSFKYQCNMCHCDGTGKTAGCTFRYCLPDEY